jgi:hypothetical protein
MSDVVFIILRQTYESRDSYLINANLKDLTIGGTGKTQTPLLYV